MAIDTPNGRLCRLQQDVVHRSRPQGRVHPRGAAGQGRLRAGFSVLTDRGLNWGGPAVARGGFDPAALAGQLRHLLRRRRVLPAGPGDPEAGLTPTGAGPSGPGIGAVGSAGGGSRTNTGIDRSVRVLVVGVVGVGGDGPSHQTALSSPVTSRATRSVFTGPSRSSTCGSATRLGYQCGWVGAPPWEATTA